MAVGLVVLLLVLLVLALTDRSDPGRSVSLPLTPARPAAAGTVLASPTSTTDPASTTDPPTTTGPPVTTDPPVTTTTTTAPPSTTTTSTPLSPTGSPLPPPIPGPVTAVGDSILLDVEPYLQADIPGVRADGVVGRQFATGIGVVAADRAAGTLGNVLVVELGTNGTVTGQDVDAMMQAAAGAARVVFVNLNVPRPWEEADNAVLAAGVARYPGLAYLADWYTLSSGHPDWFDPDQVHLDPAGAQALAQLIAEYT
jgi:hypothetical protein